MRFQPVHVLHCLYVLFLGTTLGVAGDVRVADAQAFMAGAFRPPSPPERVQGCKLSIVGTGYGGVYFAYRLVEDEGKVKAKDLCFFEASSRRIGGKVYSLRNLPLDPTLTVDVGAYRYASGHRLLSQLIEKRLELNTACYFRITCEDMRRVVVDGSGMNLMGYVTPIETMLRKLEAAGSRIFYGYKLTNLVDVDPVDVLTNENKNGPVPVELKFDNGGSAVTQQVMLNIPSEAIASLHQNSILFTKNTKLSHVGYGVTNSPTISKIYVHYEDAWWMTKLGLLEGNYDEPSDPKLEGRYHDGPVRCFDEIGRQVPSTSSQNRGVKCGGVLQAAYFGAEDAVRESFYTKFQATDDPLTIIERGKPDKRIELLEAVHNKLMEFHKQKFADAGLNTSSIDFPAFVYMTNWKETNTLTSSYHDWPKYIPGADFSAIIKALLRPIPGYDIFLANEAFGVHPGWAEGSVMMAERVLGYELGIDKPFWLQDDSYYFSVVLNPEFFDLDTVEEFGVNLPTSGPKS